MQNPVAQVLRANSRRCLHEYRQLEHLRTPQVLERLIGSMKPSNTIKARFSPALSSTKSCKDGGSTGSWRRGSTGTNYVGTLMCGTGATFNARSYRQAVWSNHDDLTLRYVYVPEATTYPDLYAE